MNLNSILKYGKWKNLFMCLVLQFCVVLLMAQVQISGKVTDPAGNGVPGISVTVHNTNLGTATDANGNYTISGNLKPGTYTLEFSGVGFRTKTQSLQVGSASSYTADTRMAEDALNLDEVVVTGVSQGTTKKQMGSYVSTVKADQLNKGVPGNVLQALQGKTAGAQIIQNSGDPAGGISVRLRGISSINSSSEPLYIVDGIIVNNATNRVTNTSGNYDGSNFVGIIGQKQAGRHQPCRY